MRGQSRQASTEANNRTSSTQTAQGRRISTHVRDLQRAKHDQKVLGEATLNRIRTKLLASSYRHGGADLGKLFMQSDKVMLARKHSTTQTLDHSNTQTLDHSNTQALDHSNTQTLEHSNTQTLKHSSTQTLKHSNTQTLEHSLL